MITVYHNNRCSKSREAINYLTENNITFEIRYYLENPLTENEITNLIKLLNIKPIELVRVKEKEWIDTFKGRNLSDKMIVELLAQFPKLIERPIVSNGEKAVIARPYNLIESII